jgi:hypothetical protein
MHPSANLLSDSAFVTLMLSCLSAACVSQKKF